jgi:hypothetical protein
MRIEEIWAVRKESLKSRTRSSVQIALAGLFIILLVFVFFPALLARWYGVGAVFFAGFMLYLGYTRFMIRALTNKARRETLYLATRKSIVLLMIYDFFYVLMVSLATGVILVFLLTISIGLSTRLTTAYVLLAFILTFPLTGATMPLIFALEDPEKKKKRNILFGSIGKLIVPFSVFFFLFSRVLVSKGSHLISWVGIVVAAGLMAFTCVFFWYQSIRDAWLYWRLVRFSSSH